MRLRLPRVERCAIAVGGVALASAARLACAQGLPVKTALGGQSATGCATYPPPAVITAPTPPAAEAEARRLIASAQDAALLGEHDSARDAFAKASELAPGNARIAYYLGREYEALQNASQAVRAYCRYLTLVPNAADADEVRGRVVRLVPSTELARLEGARASFQTGVMLLQRRDYAGADSAFSAVSRTIPSAAEAYYNRALSRAARGSRATAVEDFEKYLELVPSTNDRTQVRSAMTRLQDGVYGSGAAFLWGLAVPGLGQMNTGRPVVGTFVLALAGGAAVVAAQSQTKLEIRSFTDPFGHPYVDSVPKSTHPNLAGASAAAAVLWLGAAWEAMAYARRSRAHAESIIAPATLPSERRTTLHLAPTARGASLAVRVTFGAPHRDPPPNASAGEGTARAPR